MAVVIAPGPSLSIADVHLIARAGIRSIAVNDAVYIAWWADYAYACDAKWWAKHNYLPGFPGQRVSLEETNQADIMKVEKGAPRGVSDEYLTINHGSNSGYQAVQLAYQLGARQVILTGFDMWADRNKPDHYFGNHPKGLNKPLMFDMWREFFHEAAPLYAERGCEIINCSRTTTLRCFPRMDLAVALNA